MLSVAPSTKFFYHLYIWKFVELKFIFRKLLDVSLSQLH